MDLSLHAISRELVSEWPYLLYLALMIVFSTCFLVERRREIRVLTAAVRKLQTSVDALQEQPGVTSSRQPENHPRQRLSGLSLL